MFLLVYAGDYFMCNVTVWVLRIGKPLFTSFQYKDDFCPRGIYRDFDLHTPLQASILQNYAR